MTRVALATALVVLVGVACSDEPEAEGSPRAPEPVEITEAGNPLPAGLYTYGEFEIPFSFELPEGWTLDDTFSEFMYVRREEEVFVAFAHPSHFYSGKRKIPAGELSPEDAVQALAERADDGRVADDVTVAGEPSPTVEFTMDEPLELFGGEQGDFSSPLARHFRVSAVAVDDELLLVMQAASKLEGWDETEPVVSSIDL